MHTHTDIDTQLSGVKLSSRQFRTFDFTIGQCNVECELQLKCQSIAKRQWEICTIHKCGKSVTELPPIALPLSLSLTDLFTHYAWHATCRHAMRGHGEVSCFQRQFVREKVAVN